MSVVSFVRVALCSLVVALAACGGGAGDGATSSAGGSQDTGCFASSADRATFVASGDPRGRIEVAGVAAVDLGTSLPAGAAGSVRIELAAQPDVEAASLETQTFLGYRSGDPRTLSITLPQRPGDAGVPVELAVRDCLPATANSFLVVLAYAATDRVDGVPAMTVLSTTHHRGTGRLSATVPASAFQGGDGSFTARLKVGITGEDGRQALADARARPLQVPPTILPPDESSFGVLTARPIPCPLAGGCVETSLFNPYRRMPVDRDGTRWLAPTGQHLGTDFRAAPGTDVLARPGLVVVGGRTPERHRQMLAAPGDNFAKRGSGIYLVLLDEVSFDRYRYLHLSSLASWAIDPADPTRIAVGARVPAPAAGATLTRIGSTGRTGLAPVQAAEAGGNGTGIAFTAEPRLHFEFAASTTVRHCRVAGTGAAPTCVGFPAHADPMLVMVRTFRVTPDVPGPYPLDTSVRWRIAAEDALGQPVSSEVTAIDERVPGHATRKLCLRTNQVGVTVSADPGVATAVSEDGQWRCVDWAHPLRTTLAKSGRTEFEAAWTKTADRIARVGSGVHRPLAVDVDPLGAVPAALRWLPAWPAGFAVNRTFACQGVIPGTVNSVTYRVADHRFVTPGGRCANPVGVGSFPAVDFGPSDLTGFAAFQGIEGGSRLASLQWSYAQRRSDGTVLAAQSLLSTSAQHAGLGAIQTGMWQAVPAAPGLGEAADGLGVPPPPVFDVFPLVRDWVKALDGAECQSSAPVVRWRLAYDAVEERLRWRELVPATGQPRVIELPVADLLREVRALSYRAVRPGSDVLPDGRPLELSFSAPGVRLREVIASIDEAIPRSTLLARLDLPLATPERPDATIDLTCLRR